MDAIVLACLCVPLALSYSTPDSNFLKSPPEALKWPHRRQNLLGEILRSNADIICLEEIDHFQDFYLPELSQRGFEGVFKSKIDSPCLYVQPNNGPDGCAMFYRSTKFTLVQKKELILKDPQGEDSHQVAILMKFECKSPLTPTSEHLQHFCVAVTHLKAKSGHQEHRLAQGKHLVSEMTNFAQGVPYIICGDFNAPPDEPVYQYFASHQDPTLVSAYTAGYHSKEPPFTSWKFRPSKESKYTIDYIWYTPERLAVRGVWKVPTEEDIGKTALPNFGYPSDHVAIAASFQLQQS